MPRRLETLKIENATQAQGAKTQTIHDFTDFMQITVIPSTGATGILSFEIQPDTSASYEPIINPSSNTIQTINLSANEKSFVVDGYFAKSLRVTPSSVVGSYTVLIKQSTQLR